MVSQTIQPERWFIVDDGSSDRTGPILQKHAETTPFIESIHRQPSEKEGFLSKVEALNLALERVLGTDVSFIGVLDADVTFDPRYFEKLISRFHENAALGVSGGAIYVKNGTKYSRHRVALHSVSGAVQMFRKEVLESVAPFRPFRNGGEDAACTIIARAGGWHTRHFRDLRVLHHRPVGLGGRQSHLTKRFRRGRMFFDLGYSPSFHVARSVGRIWEKPILIGPFVEIAGFLFHVYRGRKPLLPDNVVQYLRCEQRRRLLGRVLRVNGSIPARKSNRILTGFRFSGRYSGDVRINTKKGTA